MEEKVSLNFVLLLASMVTYKKYFIKNTYKWPMNKEFKILNCVLKLKLNQTEKKKP